MFLRGVITVHFPPMHKPLKFLNSELISIPHLTPEQDKLTDFAVLALPQVFAEAENEATDAATTSDIITDKIRDDFFI